MSRFTPTLAGQGPFAVGFWIPDGAAFVMDINSMQVPATVTVDGKFMRVDGSVMPFSKSAKATVNGTTVRQLLQTGPGWVLGCVATADATIVNRGTTYVRLCSAWGTDGTQPCLGEAACGYVSVVSSVSYPGGVAEAQGTVNVSPFPFTFPAPGVGLDGAFSFVSGGIHVVHCVQVQLVCSATVATRNVVLNIDPGSGRIIQINPLAQQTAGQTVLYNWIRGSQVWPAIAGQQLNNIPEIGIGPGGVISTVTANLQAGDQFTGLVVHGPHVRAF